MRNLTKQELREIDGGSMAILAAAVYTVQCGFIGALCGGAYSIYETLASDEHRPAVKREYVVTGVVVAIAIGGATSGVLEG